MQRYLPHPNSRQKSPSDYFTSIKTQQAEPDDVPGMLLKHGLNVQHRSLRVSVQHADCTCWSASPLQFFVRLVCWELTENNSLPDKWNVRIITCTHTCRHGRSSKTFN